MRQIADISEDQYIDLLEDFYIKNHPDNNFYKLYIHYPFCKSICKYCIYSGYPFNGNGMTIGRYEDRVIKMLKKIDSFLIKHSIDLSTISFGGGTPSLWSKDKIRKIIDLSLYKRAKFIEIESHHEDLSDEKIDFMISEMKINRISIGVQTFNEDFIISQNRKVCNINILSSVINKFKSRGVIVNLDLIAFIDEDKDLLMLKNDIYNAFNMNPDTVIITPNFKSEDFFNNVKKLRLFLSEYIKYDKRFSISSKNLLIDDDIIMSFGDGGYTFINNSSIHSDIDCEHVSYKTLDSFSNPDDIIDNNVLRYNELVNLISVGGIYKRVSISKTSGENPILYGCKYIPEDDIFIYGRTSIKCDYSISNNDMLKDSLTIGNQIVNTNHKEEMGIMDVNKNENNKKALVLYYYSQIKDGKISIEQVEESLREDVEAKLRDG